MPILSRIGIGLIILGIIGTFVTYKTQQEERFGNVWSRFVGIGVFMIFMGYTIGL